MVASFNRPPRCQDCELAGMEGMSRNCKGPVLAQDLTTINDRFSIDKQGDIVRTPTDNDGNIGALVCRNPKLNEVLVMTAVEELYAAADDSAIRRQTTANEHFFGSDYNGD